MFHLFGLQKPIFPPPVSAVRPSGFAASRKTATRQSPLRAPGLDGTNNRNTLFGVKNIIKHNIYIYAFNTYYTYTCILYIYYIIYIICIVTFITTTTTILWKLTSPQFTYFFVSWQISETPCVPTNLTISPETNWTRNPHRPPHPTDK